MKWNYGPSQEAGFYSIIAETGKIIAIRVPDKAIAKQICREHDLAEELSKIFFSEIHDDEEME